MGKYITVPVKIPDYELKEALKEYITNDMDWIGDDPKFRDKLIDVLQFDKECEMDDTQSTRMHIAVTVIVKVLKKMKIMKSNYDLSRDEFPVFEIIKSLDPSSHLIYMNKEEYKRYLIHEDFIKEGPE